MQCMVRRKLYLVFPSERELYVVPKILNCAVSHNLMCLVDLKLCSKMVFCKLWYLYNAGFFMPGFPKLKRFNDHHQLILRKYLPKVAKHLVSIL